MLFLLFELVCSSITEEDYQNMVRFLNSISPTVPQIDEQFVKNFFKCAFKQKNEEIEEKLYKTMLQLKTILKVYNKCIDEIICGHDKPDELCYYVGSGRTEHYPKKVPLN